MADNVTVDNGGLTDYTVSSDEAASGQVQRVKLALSADGSDTHVSADADGLLVNLGANNDVTLSEPISVDDNGGSLTVDGTVGVSGTVAVTQSGTWDEVGINDSGNSITVDDGGGSLTVDGTVGVSGTVTVDSELPAAAALTDNFANPTAPGVGAFGMLWDGANWDRAPGNSAAGLKVDLGADNDVVISDGGNVISVDDAGGSITVDGTVAVSGSVDTELPAPAALADNTGNPTAPGVGAFGMLWDGANWDRSPGNSADGTLVNLGANNDVTVTGTVTVGGTAAHGSPTSGNPVYAAGRASNAVPTDVGADGDAAGIWTNRNGAPVVTVAPHVGLIDSPWNLTHEAAQYTTTQTSTVLVAGGASEKIVVTNIQIQAFDTAAGDCIVYFGTGAYSRGTNRAIFDGTFKPSTTLAPGINMQGPFISGTNGDDILVTTTNNLDVTISVWYYVVT